jgi:hypothetical protein
MGWGIARTASLAVRVLGTTDFQDSNRHLANLLKEIADRLPAPTPT